MITRRSNMKQKSSFALAVLSSLAFSWFGVAHASEAQTKHSMEADYGFLIGRWTCHVTQAGTPDQTISAEYEWSFETHILRERMRLGDKLIGEFLTSYDRARDGFKGVGVGAWGYVVWENAGFQNGHLSERGFVFDSGNMRPVSRSEFERVSDSHYVVHDFEADTATASGKATDTED
jgi:hypothetical protein